MARKATSTTPQILINGPPTIQCCHCLPTYLKAAAMHRMTAQARVVACPLMPSASSSRRLSIKKGCMLHPARHATTPTRVSSNKHLKCFMTSLGPGTLEPSSLASRRVSKASGPCLSLILCRKSRPPRQRRERLEAKPPTAGKGGSFKRVELQPCGTVRFTAFSGLQPTIMCVRDVSSSALVSRVAQTRPL